MLDTIAPEVSRRAGLQRLEDFIPRAGNDYARDRNHDLGPQNRSNISLLSPYARRRLVLEEEIVRAACERHSVSACAKFVQEVVWRSYWKGWLEQRPAVWSHYLKQRARDRENVSHSAGLRKIHQQAVEGRTGIDCFDFWARELVETGYLHNHARMWFASIWIFTLKLPWSLGADFFYHHLLDGDPASNTLSWRWVGGLHTQGKTYLALASNIEKFTAGRFSPHAGSLASSAMPLETDHATPLVPLPQSVKEPIKPARIDWSLPTALLLTEDDLCPESLGLPLDGFDRAIALSTAGYRTEWAQGASSLVRDFEQKAFADTAARLRDAGGPDDMAVLVRDNLSDFIQDSGLRQIVLPHVPAGSARDALAPALAHLEKSGIAVISLTRQWDSLIWPHATAGFFRIRKKLPELLPQLVGDIKGMRHDDRQMAMNF